MNIRGTRFDDDQRAALPQGPGFCRFQSRNQFVAPPLQEKGAAVAATAEKRLQKNDTAVSTLAKTADELRTNEEK